jgi:hypothetical protein
MLAQAVKRLDGVFVNALETGRLRPDPTLRMADSGEIDPAIQRLIDIGRAVRSREAAASASAAEGAAPRIDAQPVITTQPQTVLVRSITVQFATPDAASFDSGLSAVRGANGVRGVAVTSTAVGGTSVMSVTFGGTQEELAAALQARGFSVRQGQNALAISR